MLRTLTPARWLPALVLLPMLLIGPTALAGGKPKSSPYAGQWAGTLILIQDKSGEGEEGGEGGDPAPAKLSLTVDEKGRIIGAWFEETARGTLAGRVKADGTLTLTARCGDEPAAAATGKGQTRLSGGNWDATLPITGDPDTSMFLELVRN
jgi:hypothetical protein